MLMTRAAMAEVQCSLAELYRDGNGVRQDMAEAARFFRKAADQGHAQAQCGLGRMTRRGEGGLKKDDEAAAQLFRRAADQGFPQAQSNLGLCY